MMRRMSKYIFFESFSVVCLIPSGLQVIFHKQQAHCRIVLYAGSLVSKYHADSRVCRWDSDDLSEITDDEWDDDA